MNKRILIQVLLLIVLFSCNTDNEFDFALIQTGDVTSIDSTGATFHAKISDLSNSNILNYGFVWSTKSNPEIHNSEKYVITGTPSEGIISKKISTTLKDKVIYYVRAFIRNDNYITYGKEVTFTSLGSSAPDILDYFPKTGNINDTLYIIGSNFSYITNNNKVNVDNFQAEVIYSVQDTLVAIIPDKLNVESSTISVSIFGNVAKSTEGFNLILPILNGFKDKTGTFSSQITISGNNFLSNPSSVHVYFDKFEADINSIQDQSIIVSVPDSLDKRKSYIKITMNNITVSSTDQFNLESTSIIDFSPKVAFTGNTITLTGNNFSPISKNNIVTIGGLNAVVKEASLTELKVTLPLQNKGYYEERNAKINIKVIEEDLNYQETLTINDKWFRREDCPISNPNESIGFVINGKAYCGLNQSSELWEFNPQTNSWKKMESFPGTPRRWATGFAYDQKIYFGTGYSNTDLADFWVFDVNTNSWERKQDFQGDARCHAVGFSVGNNGYIGNGVKWFSWTSPENMNDFWKYDFDNDIWSRSIDFPVNLGYSHSFIYNGNAYILSSDYDSFPCYRFDKDANEWILVFDQIGDLNGTPIGFNIHDDVYFTGVSFHNQPFIRVNLLTSDIAVVKNDILTLLNSGFCAFSINNIGYIVLGGSRAIWEYDPNRY